MPCGDTPIACHSGDLNMWLEFDNTSSKPGGMRALTEGGLPVLGVFLLEYQASLLAKALDHLNPYVSTAIIAMQLVRCLVTSLHRAPQEVSIVATVTCERTRLIYKPFTN